MSPGLTVIQKVLFFPNLVIFVYNQQTLKTCCAPQIYFVAIQIFIKILVCFLSRTLDGLKFSLLYPKHWSEHIGEKFTYLIRLTKIVAGHYILFKWLMEIGYWLYHIYRSTHSKCIYFSNLSYCMVLVLNPLLFIVLLNSFFLFFLQAWLTTISLAICKVGFILM